MSDRRLWNSAVETLSEDALRALQLDRLRAQVAYNYDRSPFHRRTFEAAGAAPGDIRTFEDFAALPMMDKEGHRAAQAESLDRHGDPYALFAAAPRDEIVRINATSGTTGDPTLYTLTAHDVAVVNEMHARKYWRTGIRPGSVMVQALSLSMFTGGLPLSQGIQHLGAAVVPVGVEGGTRRVVDFTRLTRADALIATPSFGRHLIEECPALTGAPARDLGITRFYCAGEPGGGDPEVRRLLAEGFGAAVYDHTGGGHAFHGISCDHGAAMHFVSPDHCLLELVDPDSKAPLAVTDGAVGEMVWTFLDWRGGPFMRYAIGDIAEVLTSPCPCGLPGLRFRILGRADDMLIVKGVNVYPQAIGNVIAAFVPRVTGAFRVVLDKPGPLVEPPLRVRLERGDDTPDGDLPALEAEVLAALRTQLRISPALHWLPPRTLPREAMKTRLVEVGGGA
ncbi:MAG: phenylacetate--CoA ligase family protein [Hyphomicrobiales bacterium]|nr:phenylacetate--CoA ligase family protein [Hyphomicrobiales bacterium]MCP5374206.1 phenylacetate--CoA ligase family protein [Hyphomicrobiales bacterium]